MASGSDSSGPPPLVWSPTGSSDGRTCGEYSGDSDKSDMETSVALVVMKCLADVHNGSVGVKASGTECIGEKGKKNAAETAEKKQNS